LVWLCLAFGLGIGMAATRYISEEFEVPMRSGQSTEHRIIALIPSGRAVELITRGDEWSQVRLPNGREGWVLTRYLTDKVPSALQLERLERRHAEVARQHGQLQEKTAELRRKTAFERCPQSDPGKFGKSNRDRPRGA
jgi:SH3 domain protein